MSEDTGGGPGAIPKGNTGTGEPAGPHHHQPATTMDATTTVYTRPHSPPNGEVLSPKTKNMCHHPLTPPPKSMKGAASQPPAASPAPALMPTPATLPAPSPAASPSTNGNPVILISSLHSRCFVHPAKVTRAVYGSVFEKKVVEGTIRITGGGDGVRFEVANLTGLPHGPELVTRLGDWPVKCWVAGTDPTARYTYGRIYPVDTDLPNDIIRAMTVLGGSLSTPTQAYRLTVEQEDGTRGPGLNLFVFTT